MLNLVVHSHSASKETVIPVYLNYKLLAEPFELNTQEGDSDLTTIHVLNLGSSNYNTVRVDDLPEGARIASNNCEGSLNSRQQCTVALDLSNVAAGDGYHIKLTGITNNDEESADINSPDTTEVNLVVNSGW